MSSNEASGNNPTGGTAGATAVVEETPRADGGSPGLDPHQQRETMAGDPPSGGTSTGSVASPTRTGEHKGIRAAMQKTVNSTSPTEITNECNAFMTLVNNYSDDEAKTLLTKLTNPYNKLKIYVSMKKTGGLMQVLWAIGQYTAVDPDWDLAGDRKIACAGDRNKFGHAPPMLALPKDNMYKWKKIKADWDDNEAFLAAYNDPANRHEFLTMSNQGTNKQFPRVLYLPYHLGVFACDNHTPFELYCECERWKGEDNNPYPAEYLKFIQNWCRAAMFKANDNASVLQLNSDPVTADTEAFQNWRQQMMVYYLGEFEQSQTPATAATSQGASSQQDSDNFDKIEAMAERILKVAAVKQIELVQEVQKASPSGINPMKGTKYLDGSELYALMTMCNVMTPAGIPTIWKWLYGSSATPKQKRAEVKKQMVAWATKNAKQINPLIFLEKSWLEDMNEMNLSAGEGRATYTNIERGWSLHAILAVTVDYISKQERKERAAANTHHTRTMSEEEQLSKSDPKAPPKSIEELKLAVGTAEALTFVCMGPQSDIYRKLDMLWEALHGPDVIYALKCFTKEVIISYWFDLLDATRQYTFKEQSKEDFESTQGPIFPRLQIQHILEAIKAGRKVENGMLPYMWKKLGGVQGQQDHQPPPQYQLPPPAVPKPNGFGVPARQEAAPGRQPFNDRTNHCHPLVLQAMKGVHKITQGVVDNETLNKLVQRSGLKHFQLPFMTNYKSAGGKNNLCYCHILGHCAFGTNCKKAHVTKDQMRDDFVAKLLGPQGLKDGIDYFVRNPSSGSKRPAGGQ